MQLNCDLGESFGSWTMGLDAEVMPHIDQANIATGFHAGDPMIMRRTLALAAEHGVTVGAHAAEDGNPIERIRRGSMCWGVELRPSGRRGIRDPLL